MVYLGKTNITGGLSRLDTLRQADGGKERDSARAIVKNSMPVASSKREIDEDTYRDVELS